MSDKIAKLLAKLSQKDLVRINLVLEKIKQLNFEGLDIKASKTHKGLFRVRVGRYRIIFEHKDKNIVIKKIDRRDESTYRDF